MSGGNSAGRGGARFGKRHPETVHVTQGIKIYRYVNME